MKLFSLENKIILLTGAARGIGLALSRGLRSWGAKVAVFDKERPRKILKGITYYKVNLEDRFSIEEGFAAFFADHKRIDVLINNAGVTLSAPSEEYSYEDWEKTMAVNLSAVFFLCQLAGQKMIKAAQGGSIINVTSIGSAQGFPNNPAYVASKGGIRQLTKALASDWGKHGIRVNNLAPGYTHTPMNQKSWDNPQLRRSRADHTMLGRWAEPEDMLGPVVFLASDASRYVTGIDLFVDGGWNAKGI